MGSVVFDELYQDPDDGKIVLHSNERDWTLSWDPSWFRTAPVLTDNQGNFLEFEQTGATLYASELAFTIMHEIGHTLGLCHTDVPECSADYSVQDRINQARSTMSYDADSLETDGDPAMLHFLNSEWRIVNTYLTCPPQGPLTELASGASASAIRDAKYTYSLQTLDEIELRECSALEALEQEYEPNIRGYGHRDADCGLH